MGPNPCLSKRRRSRRAVALAAATVAGGCAVFGGRSGEEPVAASLPTEEVRPRMPPPEEADSTPLPGSMEERMRAGDYEGVLAAYAADSTLHSNEDATYRAGVAAAMSGHPGHDPRRAATLFERLLREHPDTSRRLEVELYLDLLARSRDLRATIGRLDRELKQLKAIDLGRTPESASP